MKIRSGFVSNSSSSSFVIVAPKDSVIKVLKSLKNEYERACVKHVMSKKKFLGTDVCVFQGMRGDYDSWGELFNEDDSEGPVVVFNNFIEKLKVETKNVIESKISC